ncbi:MAG: SIMPL domain-containing protein [Nitrosopumilaceae archaeon]
MQRRHALIFGSLGVAVLLTSIFLVPQFSYSILGINPVIDLLSKSDLTTITISGESSAKIEPDQVSIILNVQTPPTDIDSTASKREESVKKVVDAIISTANLNETSIKIGQTTLNPIYSGSSPQPATLFNSYSSLQIKTDADNLSTLSSNLVTAGYRIDNIQIVQVKVPVNTTKAAGTAGVSIVSGSSTPNDNLEYFSPSKLTVQLGTTVIWTNDDSAAHTVTSGQPTDGPSGLFDSALFAPGNSFEYQFNSAGVHDYFCMVHPWMTGTITVPEGDESSPTETKYQVNMNVAIETQPAPLPETIKKYEEKLNALKKTLESNGIPSDVIQNNQVSFNPLYYGYGGGQSTVYSTYTQIIVRTDYAKVDSILKAAQDSGAYVENMIMSVSDSKIDDIKAELTQQALQDAMKNAQEIIEPSGVQIKGIKKIEVNTKPVSQYGGGPVMYRGVSMWTQYDPSYLRAGEASVSVTAEFEVGK